MKLKLFISNVSSLNQDDLSGLIYFVKVEAKGICEEIMTDNYDHTLNSGKKYFWGEYLQKVRSRKSNKKQSQLINRDIVHPDEVFEVFIEFDDVLAIDMSTFI